MLIYLLKRMTRARETFMLIFDIVGRVLAHPLTGSEKLRALSRFARWQIGSRLLGAPVLLPFIDRTRLSVEPGMTGATGNWYCGLWELDEMGFLLHFLRPDNLFVDVGANVGSHTVLASGAAGARTIAVEPIPSTFAKLQTNIRVNDLASQVEAHCCGLSAETGEIEFISGMDTLNRVALEGEAFERVRVPVRTLDDLCSGRIPKVVKIDVEGHEIAVLAGGARVLADSGVEAALLETNELGARYGSSDMAIIQTMKGYGFIPCTYNARERLLSPQERGGANTIFVRNVDAVQSICRSAPMFTLVNGQI